MPHTHTPDGRAHLRQTGRGSAAGGRIAARTPRTRDPLCDEILVAEVRIAREVEEVAAVAEARGEQVAEARGEQVGEARGEQVAEARGEQVAEARGEQVAEARGEQVGEARGEQVGGARGEQVGEDACKKAFSGRAVRGSAVPSRHNHKLKP